jgi:integrase/recombinase XerD
VEDSARLESFLSHLAVERGLSRNTIEAYRRDLSGFLHFLQTSDLNLGSASTLQISEYLAATRSSGRSDATLARCAVAIRTFYRFLAKDQGLIDRAKELRPMKIPRRLPKALTIAEVSSLIDGAGNEGVAIRDRALIELLYATGGRVSEIIALDIGDLRRESELSTVKLRGKGGKERIVPIGSFARLALDQYLTRIRPSLAKGNEPALFISARGARLTRQSAWQLILKAAKNAGLERKVSPHALRHSFATHLIDGGADIRVVQELLGHASVTTTQIYTLVTIDKLRESFASAHPRAR